MMSYFRLKATNIYNSFQLPCIVEQNRVVGLLKCICYGLNNNVEVYPAYGDLQCSIAAAKANWNEAGNSIFLHPHCVRSYTFYLVMRLFLLICLLQIFWKIVHQLFLVFLHEFWGQQWPNLWRQIDPKYFKNEVFVLYVFSNLCFFSCMQTDIEELKISRQPSVMYMVMLA